MTVTDLGTTKPSRSRTDSSLDVEKSSGAHNELFILMLSSPRTSSKPEGERWSLDKVINLDRHTPINNISLAHHMCVYNLSIIYDNK